MRRARVAGSLFALVCYVLAAFVITAHAWSDPTRSWPGGPGDPFKFMNFLAWVPHALATHQNPFAMRAIDYPRGVNLAWETPVPLAGLVFWPVTAAFGAVAAYNVSFVAALALDGWCTYLWLRLHVRHASAAFVGGLLAEVGPYAAAHSYGHLNLVWFAPIPLLLIVLERALAGKTAAWKLGILGGVLATVQLYLAEELLAIFTLAAVVVVVVAALVQRQAVRARARGVAIAIGSGAAVLAVLAAPMLLYQFLGPYRIHGPIQATNVYVTDVTNLVLPTSVTWLHPGGVLGAQPIRWSGNAAEQTGYLGLPLLALCVFATARWWREPRVRIAAIAGAVLLLLSFGPRLHIRGRSTVPLPGELFSHLPVLDNLLPGRLSLAVGLAAAFLLAITLDRTLPPRRSRDVATALLAAAGVAALLPTAPLPSSSVRVPRYFSAGEARELPAGSVALVAPYVAADSNTLVPMLWQAAAGFRFSMVGGYALTVDAHGKSVSWLVTPLQQAFSRIEIGGVLPAETPALRATLLAEIEHDGVSVIIVGPMPHADLAVQLVGWLEDATPRRMQGVDAWNAG